MKRQEHTFVIGRAADCDIVLNDPSVSRRHAELVCTPSGQWLLIDRRSQNGTSLQVGDRVRRIAQELIGPKDVIQFGTLRMPASELLRTAQRLIPVAAIAGTNSAREMAAAPVRPADPSPGRPAEKPWVRASRLVRCACGTVKRQGGTCPECNE